MLAKELFILRALYSASTKSPRCTVRFVATRIYKILGEIRNFLQKNGFNKIIVPKTKIVQRTYIQSTIFNYDSLPLLSISFNQSSGSGSGVISRSNTKATKLERSAVFDINAETICSQDANIVVNELIYRRSIPQ